MQTWIRGRMQSGLRRKVSTLDDTPAPKSLQIFSGFGRFVRCETGWIGVSFGRRVHAAPGATNQPGNTPGVRNAEPQL